MNKKRILLKLSGELFKSGEEALDLTKVFAIAGEIAKIKNDYALGIVFGGGNIFRGRSVQKVKINLATAHYIGMTGTLVNALALKSVFDALNVPSRIISALDYSQVIGANNKFDIDKYFSAQEILIFAGGTGNPFVSTDTAAVIHALEINAATIIKGTRVNGIFNTDPHEHPEAKQFKNLSYAAYLRIPQADVFDRTAIILAAENRLPIYVFKWQKNALKRAVNLKAGGTLIQ